MFSVTNRAIHLERARALIAARKAAEDKAKKYSNQDEREAYLKTLFRPESEPTSEGEETKSEPASGAGAGVSWGNL